MGNSVLTKILVSSVTFYLVTHSILLFLGCKGSNSPELNATFEEPDLTDTEKDEFLADLYLNYHSDPTNQSEIDENIIIEYFSS